MAVVLRKCIVCEAEFPSKNMRARFCKSTCKSIHHRATKQPATPVQETQTTIMRGNTMSQLFQPDPQQIQSLKDRAEKQYRDEVEVLTEGREKKGIYAEFVIQSLQAAFDRYAELLGQGYKASPEVRHVPQLVQGVAYDYVTLTLRKPDSVVAEEIAAIHAAEESAYMASLEQLKANAVAAEVQSLLAATRRKQQQAELDAKAAKEAEEYARVEAEVLAALGGASE